MISGSFGPAYERSVTWRQQNPTIREGQDFAIGGTDCVWCWAESEGVAHDLLLGPGITTSSVQGETKMAYATLPTMATCATTRNQKTIRNGVFFVLWRNWRCPRNAPGQPPKNARSCKVPSGTRRSPLMARALSRP